MEFGWYHEFHRQVPGQSDADAFAQDAAQLKAAPDKTKALPFMGIIPGEIRKDDQFRS